MSGASPERSAEVPAAVAPLITPDPPHSGANSPGRYGATSTNDVSINVEDASDSHGGVSTGKKDDHYRHARADTAGRRISQSQLQNELQWRKMQEQGHEWNDQFIAPSPASHNSTNQQASTPSKVLRPSSAEQNKSLLAQAVQQSHDPAQGRTTSLPSGSSSPQHVTESDWDPDEELRRTASASQSFLSKHEQQSMRQLPKEFKGAANLVMPAYLTGPISNVTLPSRLDLLGRRGFRMLASVNPRRVGNAVVGWAPVLMSSWSKKQWKIKKQLFLLPYIYSKSMAKILLFLRTVLAAIIVIFILDLSGVAPANTGRIWPVGVFLALSVMLKQSQYRHAPDGVMAFCRSMGVPGVEEYMFSYCWKVEPDNVRTLAKAVWKAGVGVWIDVVKLTPGDEIRPMVRTTVRRVHKVVVFLCDEYCQSPNCCVEMMEAIQYPEKVTVCIIKNNIHPNIMKFLIGLKPLGLRMCVGFDELMKLLDYDLQDMTDIAAFQWWRSQSISGAGVPDNLVPSNWPMSRFSLKGRMFIPEKSIDVGPMYLSGDCKQTGQSLALPWLLFLAIIAVAINLYDIVVDKYLHSDGLHSAVDYVFLGFIAGCNCAPFIGFSYLLDRRRDAHVVLRPLLASRSMGKDGIKVRVVGHPSDPIYVALKSFLMAIGHLAADLPPRGSAILTHKAENTGQLSPLSAMSPSSSRQQSVVAGAGGAAGGRQTRREPRCVTVHIIESLARRDELFGPKSKRAGSSAADGGGVSSGDNRFSLYLWSGSQEKAGVIPFTDDETGQRMMRYLVLVADWEKHSLAESLFSAIGVRVVDILHDKPSQAAGAAQLHTSNPSTPHMSMAALGQSSLALTGADNNNGVWGSVPTGSLPPSFPFQSSVPTSPQSSSASSSAASVSTSDSQPPPPPPPRRSIGPVVEENENGTGHDGSQLTRRKDASNATVADGVA